MKTFFLTVFIGITSSLYSQKSVDFTHVDWKVLSVEAAAPDTLAHWLTSSYKTDVEKARAIFSWIAENISYNAKGPYKQQFRPVKYLKEDVFDTSTVLKSLDERVAEIVLTRRLAVCDGYARLFKTLCDYAGLKSEVITGFARSGNQKSFKSNHRWNAVMIDSTWHLLDVTWASGHSAYSSNDFIKRFNDYYFLTPPTDFFLDHYPEDLHWTLMNESPTPREFNASPLKYQAYQKFKITSYFPQRGIIEASVGDTLSFQISATDATKPLQVVDSIFNNPVNDSLAVIVPPPFLSDKKPLIATYIVTPETPQWLYLVYNDEVIMRYKLNVVLRKPVQ
jgi:hypothetical protein